MKKAEKDERERRLVSREFETQRGMSGIFFSFFLRRGQKSGGFFFLNPFFLLQKCKTLNSVIQKQKKRGEMF